jgi:hypothetical protein
LASTSNNNGIGKLPNAATKADQLRQTKKVTKPKAIKVPNIRSNPLVG